MMKFFTSDLRRNLIKILCLTVGMAVGFLLVAKVYFEETFDTYFPDNDRLYLVTENVTMSDEYKEFSQTPGAIAPGLKRYVPQVEHATRFTPMLYSEKLKLPDGTLIAEVGVSLADSAFFNVFKTHVTGSDPRDIMEVKRRCAIPRSLADKIGPEAMGTEICFPNFNEDYKVTVDAIYEDYPLNTSIPNNVYVSMASLPDITYDGRENWMGNDRYVSAVYLTKGSKPEDIKPHVRKMLEENVDKESLEISHFGLGLKNFVGIHTSEGNVRTMSLILSLLALVMLLSAGLNYLLIVMGQMTHRSKEMAVRKCYGTSNLKIFGRVIAESLFFIIISLGLAMLLAWCFSDQCRRLLGYTPAQLFSTGNVWIVEGAVCLALLIITGAVPAWMYCRTPVASAFRANVKSRRIWKLALLSLQFFASGMLICILMLVARQYHKLSTVDIGYDYENTARVPLYGVKKDQRSALMEEIRRLGCVEGVASSSETFIDWASGNNVWIGDDVERQVNVADLYYNNREMIDVLGLKIIQGENFSETADSTRHEAIVEKRFIDVLKNNFNIDKDNIVGQTFHISEHLGLDGFNEFTVVGVIEDMHRGGFMEDDNDTRAGVLFPSTKINTNLFIRFRMLTPEALQEVQTLIYKMIPDKEIYVTPLKNNVDLKFEPVRNFGTAVIIIGIAIIMIALIGLIGYTTDEVNRRAKEIAIRKVAGYPADKIVKLFCLDILRVAIPSLIAGGALAMVVGRKWLSQFTHQVSLSPLSMIICLILLLAILLAVVALNSLDVARSNPVKHLRNE